MDEPSKISPDILRPIVQGPPGVANGGVWYVPQPEAKTTTKPSLTLHGYFLHRGTRIYRGTKSYLCCAIGLTTLATMHFGIFPGSIDEGVVYWVDGVYYDELGQRILNAPTSFKPTMATTAVEMLRIRR